MAGAQRRSVHRDLDDVRPDIDRTASRVGPTDLCMLREARRFELAEAGDDKQRLALTSNVVSDWS